MPRIRLLRRRTRVLVALAAALLSLATVSSTTAGAAPPEDPSGVGIPSYDGWHLRFADEFTGHSVDPSSWSVYNGHAGHRGPKSARQAIVHDGMLTLRVSKVNGQWTGSGMSGKKATLGTYGRYVIRARYGDGVGTRATALLWPTTGWPPEIDFMEFDARDPHHHELMLTNHYGSTDEMQHAFVPGDWSRWHTIGVVWTPNEIEYTLDGTVSAVMTGHVPSVPMWLGLANSFGNTVDPNGSTPDNVDFDIDWVAYYGKN